LHAWPAPQALSQYTQEVWGSREGLPEGAVLSLLEDETQQLWLGSECCLFRFDGHQFTRLDEAQGLRRHSFTRVLAGAKPQGIWAGFAGGLAHYNGAHFEWFGEAEGFAHPFTYSLVNAGDTLWIGTGGEGIWRMQAGQLARDPAFNERNMPVMIYHLLKDSTDTLWAASEGGVLRRNTGGQWSKVTTQGLPSQFISQLAEGRPGEIWVGTLAGLAKWNGTAFEAYPALQGVRISALYTDRAHQLWIGAQEKLFRLTPEGLEVLPLKLGVIHAISEDTSGNIWVGGSNGLLRLHPGPFATFGKPEGLPSDEPISTLARRDGGLWVVDSAGSLGHFVDGHFIQDAPAGSIKGGTLLGMAETADGGLWIAGSHLYRFDKGRLENQNLPVEGFSLVEALGNELWMVHTATNGASTLNRYQNGHLVPIHLGDQHDLKHIQRLYQDRAGQIWITTSGSGVLRITGNETHRFTSADGLPSNIIYGITEDPEGRIWLSTSEGIGYIEHNQVVSLAHVKGTPRNHSVHLYLDQHDRFWITESGIGVRLIARAELLKAAQNHLPEVAFELLTTQDGLRSLAFSWRRGGVTASPGGGLYFSTQRGLSVAYPGQYQTPLFNSPVHISAVQVGEQTRHEPSIQLENRSDVIEIAYTATDLTAANRLEFRTRVGGPKASWSQPTQLRSTRLSNLEPGNYTFEVAVRRQGQPWLAQTASLSIAVPPYFYERIEVQGLAVLSLFLLILMYFRWRIRSAKAQEVYLRRTVDARTVELNQEIIERKTAESKALDLAQTLEDRVQERTAELELAKMAVHRSEERFALAVQGAEDGIWDWDLEQHSLYLSPRWKAILGYKDHELPATIDAWLNAIHPDDVDLIRDMLIFSHTQPHLRQEYRMRHRDGQEIWVLCRGLVICDEQGLPLRAAGSQTDITQRKRTEDALRDSLTRDPVTELPNRALFLDRLEQALLKRRNQETQVTVLLLDIDGFKSINEHYGHAAGDTVLREIARRVLSSLRQTDTLARLGNDEFAILLIGIEEGLAQLAMERIKTALEAPITFAPHSINIAYSMGVKHVQQGETNACDLLIAVENALLHAKEQGGNRTQTVDKKPHGRRELAQELQRALKEQQFTLYYQPLVDLTRNTVVGTEALARWNHPERGLLGPLHFINQLEACGLMDAFTDWVLDTCCQQAARWSETFPQYDLRISFNLPASHLNSPNLVDNILAALTTHSIPARYLGIEIVESSLIESSFVVLNNLERLREIGLPVSIDDFGTGYSSMNYLKHFPVDCIKLDKSFCQGVPDNTRDVAICESLLSIAEQLGFKAIVEGVETEQQKTFFTAKPNVIAQGYYFCKPIEAAQCAEWIRSFNLGNSAGA
jgi:diguanylate cyclase (GGDEF)-like protein/PAS domain S-box-containing protein